MCDNRTSEFLSLAKALPSSGTGGVGSLSSGLGPSAPVGQQSALAAASEQKKKNASQYSELRNFHQTAGEISRDIATTSALLSELTQLVRHKSLLKDDNASINNLVVRIKTNIENLNSRLDQAGHTIAVQKRRLGQNSQAGQEAANLVDGLKTEFAEAASGFKKVLQQRTDNLKETENLQKSVYGGAGGSADDDDPGEIPNLMTSSLSAPPPVYASSASGGGMDYLSQPSIGGGGAVPFSLDLTSSLMSPGEATGQPMPSSLPRPHGISAPGSGGLDFNPNGSLRRRVSGASDGMPTYSGSYSTYERQHSAPAGPMTPLDIARMEQESGMQQQMQLIPDQDYLRERADAMSQVESNIVELGTIFNKLAVMVNEHKDLVQRVEDNVEEANTNINLSLGVLTDTLTSLKTNRMLALRVFSILVAFIVFFIIFFA